jgi:aminocarboxymuconate-semialdehyde decarboxylase
VNDALADVVKKYPSRFVALAALPLQDPEASVHELERAVTENNLRGAQLFSNINGIPLSDPAYGPLYAKAEALDVPLFIHPISPINVDAMCDFRLVALTGFLFDTTLAALQLVFSGVLEAHPNLKLVLGNLGGTIPYIASRIDKGYQLYPECQGKIHIPPSTYLKKLYYETAGMFDVATLQFALEFAGADRIILGSDYPQQIADVPHSVELIESLDITERDRRKILEGNAAEILKRNGTKEE